jgi:hypothetical protein
MTTLGAGAGLQSHYDPVEFVQNCQSGCHRNTWASGRAPQHVGCQSGCWEEML